MHNTLKKTINAEEQLTEHNGENIMKNTKEQLMENTKEQIMENTKEQIMENKPLFFTQPKNAGALLLFALLALSLPEHTAGATEGDYTYSLISGGEAAQVTGWTGSDVNLVIPDTLGGKPVTEIGDFAFGNKTVLQSVSFPASLLEIGEAAFWGCSGLTQFTLPASLRFIGGDAFRNCSGLTQASIPASVNLIPQSPFRGCTALLQIEVHSNSLRFSSQDGVLFDKEKIQLRQYPGGKSGPYTVPASVERILDASFAFCGELTQVTIPASVDVIGTRAFRHCAKLQTARFEGHEPGRVDALVFEFHAADFTVQFYEGARGFTDLVWRANVGDNYPAQMLPIPSLSIWRNLFGLAEEDVTAENGEPLLLAYALKLDPADSAARVPVPFVESGAFRLDFPADRSGVLLQVERSTDLPAGNWQPAGTVTNSGTASVSIPLAGSESPEKLYLRFTAAEQME